MNRQRSAAKSIAAACLLLCVAFLDVGDARGLPRGSGAGAGRALLSTSLPLVMRFTVPAGGCAARRILPQFTGPFSVAVVEPAYGSCTAEHFRWDHLVYWTWQNCPSCLSLRCIPCI